MVTFAPRGGIDGMAAFTDHLRLCDIGVSLGDVFTLVYPRPKDGGIVRVSVGCEDVGDLLEDFALGLSFVALTRPRPARRAYRARRRRTPGRGPIVADDAGRHEPPASGLITRPRHRSAAGRTRVGNPGG